MKYHSINIDVDIDINEVLTEATTEELQAELLRRNETSPNASDSNALYEDLYYALRDGDLEEATDAAKPIIEDKIGRIL